MFQTLKQAKKGFIFAINFLSANICIEVVIEMLFPTFNKANL